MKILLSIKPEYVEEIFSGRKKFEYRKSIFNNKKISKVVIYSTMPIGRIVGEFTIEDILMDIPSNIWEKTKGYSGISKAFFDEYFYNKNKAYAIKIGDITEYKEPINPYDKWDSFVAPQSFKYILEN